MKRSYDCASTCLNDTQSVTLLKIWLSCTHACTHPCLWEPIPNISVTVSFSYAESLCRLSSLPHVTIPHEVKALQKASSNPSLQCKLTWGTRGEFLSLGKVKNWTCTPDHNLRMRDWIRFHAVVPSGLADKAQKTPASPCLSSQASHSQIWFSYSLYWVWNSTLLHS